ncbi:MAG: FAD:protein FMN transferase, partial [Patescibacteria group bacterium]
METVPHAFEAIGTHWQIDLPSELPKGFQYEVMSQIRERIEMFDQQYSRFRSDSLVTAMSQKSGTYLLMDDAEPMLNLYKQLYDLTDGAFTPLIGQTLVQAGYDASYSLQSTQLTRPLSWEDVISYTHPNLLLSQSALLDFGAAGKGYLVDLVGEVLKKNGVQTFCIDAGGDILHVDAQEQILRVGLEDPQDTTRVIGVATIENESICGSAGNRRAWGTFHHTINPHTLTSPNHMLATWVIASTAML